MEIDICIIMSLGWLLFCIIIGQFTPFPEKMLNVGLALGSVWLWLAIILEVNYGRRKIRR